jgi:hypothetical protein
VEFSLSFFAPIFQPATITSHRNPYTIASPIYSFSSCRSFFFRRWTSAQAEQIHKYCAAHVEMDEKSESATELKVYCRSNQILLKFGFGCTQNYCLRMDLRDFFIQLPLAALWALTTIPRI